MNRYSRTSPRNYIQSMVLQPSLFGSPLEALKGGDLRVGSWKYVAANFIFAVTSLVLLAYYIIQINGISGDTYRLTTLNGRLATLNETGSALADRQPLAQDPGFLADFASRRAMVPARDVVYLFENGTVAINQGR